MDYILATNEHIYREDGDSKFLRNVGNHDLEYTMS